MAKWYGKIGYSVTSETAPGVWSEGIITRNYYGDMTRNISHTTSSDKVNSDISVNNQLSIVSDPYSLENFSQMRWAEFMGARWTISSVEVNFPRLVLTLGGVYTEQDET
jgi:hypothetical protein